MIRDSLASRAMNLAQEAKSSADAALIAARTASDAVSKAAEAINRSSAETVEVRGKLQTHEAVCAQRQGQILNSLKGLWWVVLVSAGTLIVGMAGLLSTVLVSHGHLPLP